MVLNDDFDLTRFRMKILHRCSQTLMPHCIWIDLRLNGSGGGMGNSVSDRGNTVRRGYSRMFAQPAMAAKGKVGHDPKDKS